MQLTGLVPVLARWWLTLLATTVLAGCVGLFAAAALDPTYEAEVRLLVGPINTDVNTLRASGQLARTYAELASSEPLLIASITQLQSPRLTPDEVEVQATADEVTRVLSVRVRSRERRAVAVLANGLAEQLEDRVVAGTIRPEGELQVIDVARPPEAPVAPRLALTGVLASIAGLLVSVTLVLLYEYLTPMVRTPEQFARFRSDVDVIGSLNRVSWRARRRSPAAADAIVNRPDTATSALAVARLHAAAPAHRADVMLILGAGVVGQASQVALNVAAVIAAQGQRPLLIEADRLSGLSTALRIPPHHRGLSDELDGRGGAAGDARPVQVDLGSLMRAEVFPFGTGNSVAVGPSEAANLLAGLRQGVQPVIIEGPPIPRGPEALVWASVADAVLLVVQRNRDRLDEVDASLDTLRAVGARLAGIIIDHNVVSPRRGAPSSASPVDVDGARSREDAAAGSDQR